LTDTVNPRGDAICEEELFPILAGGQPLKTSLLQIQNRVQTSLAGARQYDDITMLAIRRCRKSSGR